LLVQCADETGDGRVAAQLVGRPAAGHDAGVEFGQVQVGGGSVAGRRQAVLALVLGAARGARNGDLRALLAQSRY
jgi:hypothetical protein